MEFTWIPLRKRVPIAAFRLTVGLGLKERRELIPCSVVNLTSEGAQLCFRQPLVLPAYFSLLLDKDGTDKRSCRVIWSKEERLGVRFLHP